MKKLYVGCSANFIFYSAGLLPKTKNSVVLINSNIRYHLAKWAALVVPESLSTFMEPLHCAPHTKAVGQDCASNTEDGLLLELVIIQCKRQPNGLFFPESTFHSTYLYCVGPAEEVLTCVA